jgi:hypothetical protein
VIGDAFVPDGCSTLLSVILAFASLAWCFALIGFALFVRRDVMRAAAQLEAMPDEGAPGVGRRTLRGVVTTIGDGPAVRIEVVQTDLLAEPAKRANARGRRGRRTETDVQSLWNEQSRSVDARPFLLLLGSGEQVRIEPSPSVRLNIEPTSIAMRDSHDRVVRLELSAGANVSCSGVISPGAGVSGAYREAAQQLVMRDGADEPLVVSAATILSMKGAPKRRASVAMYVLAMLAVEALFFGKLHLLLFDGELRDATVTEVTRESRRASEGHETFEFRLKATETTGASRIYASDTTAAAYDHRADAPPLRATFLASRHFPQIYEIGTAPRGSCPAFFLAAVLGLVLTLIAISRLPPRRLHKRMVHGIR